jgi:formate dehydrogenase subunit gamma
VITLIMAHVYFALRPEKLWMTRSMFRGWISREEFLAHHDPKRWSVPNQGNVSHQGRAYSAGE